MKNRHLLKIALFCYALLFATANIAQAEDSFYLGLEAGFIAKGNYFRQASRLLQKQKKNAYYLHDDQDTGLAIRTRLGAHIPETKLNVGAMLEVGDLPSFYYYDPDSYSVDTYGQGYFYRIMVDLDYFIFGNAAEYYGLALSAGLGRSGIVIESASEHGFYDYYSGGSFETGAKLLLKISDRIRLNINALYGFIVLSDSNETSYRAAQISAGTQIRF